MIRIDTLGRRNYRGAHERGPWAEEEGREVTFGATGKDGVESSLDVREFGKS